VPYIKQQEREMLDVVLDKLHPGLSAGELAYVVYRLLLKATLGGSFVTFATMIGATLSAVREFQIRVVDPYEKEKMNLNGDVKP
jgi:hypothetical protein